MKKMFYFMFCMMAVLAFTSCSDDDEEGYTLYPLTVQLQYPATTTEGPDDGVEVVLKNTVSGTEYKELTDDAGMAKFEVPEGLYEASASEKRVEDAKVLLFNGANSNVQVSATTSSVVLEMALSRGGSIIVKEMYFGGCPKDDGSGKFKDDKYVVLYNNSAETLELDDVALAMVNPFNSTVANKDYQNGELFYAATKQLPAGVAVWYFQGDVKLAAGEQVVIAVSGAINHTATYKNSVDLSKSDYYCFYDLDNFNMASWYPTPSASIPTSHYLKSYKFGIGKAWALSFSSPAFFIFEPEDVELKAFVEDPSASNNYGGSASQTRKMVPESWVIDGVEVFQKGATNNMKRLLPSVDAGYVEFTNGLGYTVYRNVDKEATEALESNKGKLVTGYTADPSGIDAEASIKNGARIIYMDTNNSTNDFHVREKASIRN